MWDVYILLQTEDCFQERSADSNYLIISLDLIPIKHV